MMVKPSRSGSALGCSKVSQPEQLPSAMVGAYAYGPVAVVEHFVEGREVAVAVVNCGEGPIALPIVEIRPDSGVYDYTARYTAGATRFLCPAELDDDIAQRCSALALRVHDVLGLRDLSRTDMIVTDAGEPVCLEVNVSPGMTETSSVPLAMEAAGWSLGQMCADLVRVAASRTETASVP
jgi:D-alanine-D-alanine ligase